MPIPPFDDLISNFILLLFLGFILYVIYSFVENKKTENSVSYAELLEEMRLLRREIEELRKELRE